jgi:hypothetical protein
MSIDGVNAGSMSKADTDLEIAMYGRILSQEEREYERRMREYAEAEMDEYDLLMTGLEQGDRP